MLFYEIAYYPHSQETVKNSGARVLTSRTEKRVRWNSQNSSKRVARERVEAQTVNGPAHEQFASGDAANFRRRKAI